MASTPTFSCEQCHKHLAWKPELAGKKARCKCGHIMTVPAQLAPELKPEPARAPIKTTAPASHDDDLYDLAPSNEPPKPARPVAAAVPLSNPAAGKSNSKSSAAPLGYAGGPSLKPKDRFSNEALMDKTRDIYAPIGFLVAGLVLYVGYFAFRYQLSFTGVLITTAGLSMVGAIKAALLIAFALVVATPLGVSFGGLWTAVLKLAAIAVFSDGCTTIVDAIVAKGAGSGFFAGMISFPISLGIYWGLLIYLFSMDPGDSWMVVMVLSVFDYFVRTAIIFLLLSSILSWGGAAVPGASSKNSRVSQQTLQIEEAKEGGYIKEARQWKKDDHMTMAYPMVDNFYNAGAKEVSYEIGYDLTGNHEIRGMIVELPEDKEARKKVYELLKKFYDDIHGTVDPEEFKDTGEKYLRVRIYPTKR